MHAPWELGQLWCANMSLLKSMGLCLSVAQARGPWAPLTVAVPPLILRHTWPELRSLYMLGVRDLRMTLAPLASCNNTLAAGTNWRFLGAAHSWSQNEILCQQVRGTPNALRCLDR